MIALNCCKNVLNSLISVNSRFSMMAQNISIERLIIIGKSILERIMVMILKQSISYHPALVFSLSQRAILI